jgi:NAD(P)-dependent dehydrogenase (short-subunit alcohol dehydrogenase family)
MAPTVLITGTSSGIGRASARLFQSRGWNVVATMRSPERETDLAHLERVLVTRLDVQEPASAHAAVAAALARFGRIDALVNNAGYGAYGPLEATPLEKARRQFDVNVIGLLATTQAVLPHFRQQRSGVIINISSMGGRVAFPLGTLYHGSKFAVEGLSEALHYELAPLGVRVKLVEPGIVKTDFAGRSFDFSNDVSMAEYQPVVQAVLSALGPMAADAPPPEAVAEAIHRAAADTSPRLRHEVGADAVELLATRRAVDDDAFLSGMMARFGISRPAPGDTA